jgi:hypothetical protein
MSPGKLLSAQLSTSAYRCRPHAAIVCGRSARSRRCFNVLEVLRGLGVNFRHGWLDDFAEGLSGRKGDQGRSVSQITTDVLS